MRDPCFWVVVPKFVFACVIAWRNRILRELQGQVAAAGERIQRMVKEVVGLGPELQLHTFPDLEVLEYRQIRIEERRSVGRRKHVRPILARP